MYVTTAHEGSAAVIRPCGEIDVDTLPGLLVAARELPRSVTEVTWDMTGARFMDVAGLRLLVQERTACLDAGRKLLVTGLRPQPLRLLRIAQEVFPAGEWGDFLEGERAAAA
jgi:anti-anti-sigma factor